MATATHHLPHWTSARTYRPASTLPAATDRTLSTPTLPADVVALLGTIAATALVMLAVILWYAVPALMTGTGVG